MVSYYNNYESTITYEFDYICLLRNSELLHGRL